MTGFRKILIANRGEIAVRIIRTAREMGYRTVAVYSDADTDSLHVELADEAVRIGPAQVAESYLASDKILVAAAKTGADAIHPGYGFLAENAGFARACADAGLTFIGPGADTIELMGSKRLSKAAMVAAGVPCIPGYHGADQDDRVLMREAEQVGFPLMVKASAGGGGRGMRLVTGAAELPDQINRARSEAQHAFGSSELILERALVEPRHIEIQVFADAHGNVVSLGERDCSVQRRHQKVVEEAPSPFVDEDLRRKMGVAAVKAAQSCSYLGAGTVEFLVDENKEFYFLEMNTRLQVEHPVTELVTGQDLVAWQLIVAAGQKLPLDQQQIALTGHAIEVRLYAEDPRNEFLPQTGTIRHWHYPRRDGIRVDHGIQAGQTISPHYDPLIAKVIAYGDNREMAARRLAAAMQDTRLLGVNNNRLFLQNLLRHPVFLDGAATTTFIDRHFHDDDSRQRTRPAPPTLAAAALLYYLRGERQAKRLSANRWRSAAGRTSHFRLAVDDQPVDVQVYEDEGLYRIVAATDEADLRVIADDPDDAHCCIVLDADDVRRKIHYVFAGAVLHLDDGCGHRSFRDVTHEPAVAVAAAGTGLITASTDGAVVGVLVKKGDTVAAGQTIAVLEAMKMEHHLKTTVAGIVDSIDTQVGEQVRAKQLLASITAFDIENTTGSA